MEAILDAEVCYRAAQTKDARFDGHFFLAVQTTGIYCRPICPAKMPKRENCTFFPSAAAAQQAGFRPCLRCRPELSPNLWMHLGTGSTVFRALRLIAEGALDEGGVADLAQRLGVGDRHLRQLFMQHLGTTPVVVAQTRRLLFAKQLIDETTLPMTDIAMAAGFSSIRRFNDTVQKSYGRSPSQLRRSPTAETADPAPILTLKLPFHSPYAWDAMVRFLAPRVTPGLESVSLQGYRRTIALEGCHGAIAICPVPGQSYLLTQIDFPQVRLLGQIVERLRRMFDLAANTQQISAHLQQDPALSTLVSHQPGLRVPGGWDAFELAVRAILGQQISVAAATRLAGRLVEQYGESLTRGDTLQNSNTASTDPDLRFVFPRPEVLAAADLSTLGLPRARAKAITTLSAAVATDPQRLTLTTNLEEAIASFCELPGIGTWTANYLAMRSLREPDAFPASDLGLLRAMKTLGYNLTAAELEARSQSWRPWRAYAALHLWSMDGVGVVERRSA